MVPPRDVKTMWLYFSLPFLSLSRCGWLQMPKRLWNSGAITAAW